MVVSRTAVEDRPQVTLPVLGTVPLPEPEHLAFYAALLALGVLEIVEWPVVGVVAIGHFLAGQHRFAVLREVGEAAEAA
ncbi:hypothetical protein [Nonomuraea sp. NPDC049695]|uniref:hypothetical protein n=1 Tax=Nonomuraea sp. NPDC049695 TaxID=3154734 RepID=UPI00341A83AF